MKAFLVDSSDDVDRRVLLAERDAARRDHMVAQLRADLARTQRELLEAELLAAEHLRQAGRLEEQFARLFETPSWRWTAPLRRIGAVMGRLRAVLGGPAPAVLPAPPPPMQPEAPPAPLGLREQAILDRLHRAS